MGVRDLSWGSPRFTTLVENGSPDNRLDVAIIGDGYTAGEQPLFRDDAQEIVDAFAEIEPMRTYFRHFNFHRIDVISPESGCDDPHASPAIKRRTALDTFFSPLAERRLVGPDPWVMVVATESGAPWDKLLVVVNAPRRGGATLATMKVAYASRNSSDFPRIMIHEAGHIIAKLIDEYKGDLPDIDFARGWSIPNILPWPNADTNANKPKWWRWLTPQIQLPTPDAADDGDVVGAFEGATYTSFGVYRPQRRCMMRVHSADFCKVCMEQWIRHIYRRSKIADGFLPDYQWPQPPLLVEDSEPIEFSAEVVRSENIRTTWRTKKVEHTRWSRRQRTEDYADFAVTLPANRAFGRTIPTFWFVECTLEDGTNRIRTPSIRKQSRQKHIWHIITT
jgi:hypothetical protein